MDALVVVALGFFLGIRHATDADHVVAVTTIVARQRDLVTATLTGMLWGIGHSLTVIAVGAGIVMFNVAVPDRVISHWGLSVGAMLVVLGLLNTTAFLNIRPSAWRRHAGTPRRGHSHVHSHGDYVHSHPHSHDPDVHPPSSDRTPVATLDRCLGGWRPVHLYAACRRRRGARARRIRGRHAACRGCRPRAEMGGRVPGSSSASAPSLA